jgi:hypothetical protein
LAWMIACTLASAASLIARCLASASAATLASAWRGRRGGG